MTTGVSMEILEFDAAARDEWDAFVRQHPLAGFGHLAANFDLAAATPGLRNVSLLAREGRGIVAVLPLFEQEARVLRGIPLRSVVSGAFFPAGPLISPEARGKGATTILSALLDRVRERAAAARVDNVVIAYPNVTAGQPTIARLGYSPLLHHGYHARPGVGLLLDLSQSAEQLAAGRNSGCRQRINKAQASGATVTRITAREEWAPAYALNVQTLGPLALSREQFDVIWDRFIAAGDANAYAVHVDGKLAAMTATIRVNDVAYYWHGWRAADTIPGAAHFGLWSAILEAREHGCKAFELGSLEFVNAKNIGISQFKQSFGGVPFQTLAAELRLRPLKHAAIALAEAAAAVIRERKGRKAEAVAPAPAPITAAVART